MTDNKRLVLLSPGWGNSTFNLHILESRFKKEGFDVIVVTNNSKGLKESAEKLAAILDNIHEYYTHITFVGYSMGGLVGRYLIQKLSQGSYINSYVSIATPHSGCRLAELVLWSKTASEMRRNSKFIEELDSYEWPLQIPALSLQAAVDEVIRPTNSVRFNHAENIVVPYTSHLSIVFSPRTFYEIYSWICSIFFPEQFHTAPSIKGIMSKIG